MIEYDELICDAQYITIFDTVSTNTFLRHNGWQITRDSANALDVVLLHTGVARNERGAPRTVVPTRERFVVPWARCIKAVERDTAAELAAVGAKGASK